MRTICTVPSLSDDKKRWTIRMHDDGVGCDCPAFDYSAEPKACKHTAIYGAAWHAQQRCAELHGARGGGVCMQCLVDVLAVAARKVKRGFVPADVVDAIKAKARAKVVDIRQRARRKK